MKTLKRYILGLIFLSVAFCVKAQEPIKQTIIKELRNASGFRKAVLLYELSEAESNMSIDKTINYALHTITYLDSISGRPFDFSNPGYESDSILKLRAAANYRLGKSYLALLKENSDTTKNSFYTNKAGYYLKVSLTIRQFQKDSSGIAKDINELAFIEAIKGNRKKADSLFEKALKIYEKLHDKTGIAMVASYIGLSLKDSVATQYKAEMNFKTAYQYFMETGDSLNAVKTMAELAELYFTQDLLDEAQEQLLPALKFCVKHNLHVTESWIHGQLAKIYEKDSAYSLALMHLKRHNKIMDSVLNEKNITHLNELSFRYENEKKDLRIIKLNKQTIIDQYIIFITLGILLVGLYYLYRNHRLNKKLTERNIQIHNQNEQIKHQKDLIEEVHENLYSSINYAARLQMIIIKGSITAENILKDYFLIYLPRDVVSGDFYYVRDYYDDCRVVAVADCTGHGVPAAFLSVLNITFLNEFFNDIDHKPDPATLLEVLRIKIKNTLNQNGDVYSSTDGMDIAIVIADRKQRTASYAGAYIDLFIVDDKTKKVRTIKSVHNPIGWYNKESDFSSEELSLNENDVLYMFSDGYTDQINVDVEKFTKYRMRKIMEEFAPYDLQTQKQLYIENFINWKKNVDQVDDVLLMGVRAHCLYD
ncbi:MAG: serine/threonine-protein phosphatase [Bacteroidales bacterium]|nr:serine/threonine-protein phosphatase [Bacteroidales bacterium]